MGTTVSILLVETLYFTFIPSFLDWYKLCLSTCTGLWGEQMDMAPDKPATQAYLEQGQAGNVQNDQSTSSSL